MSAESREAKLNSAFVAVAGTLTADYDVVDPLRTLVVDYILDAQAGGLTLADPGGELQLVASTSESASLVEIMRLNAGAGPCVDRFATGIAVEVADIASTGSRWPEFREAALDQGFVPCMRRRCGCVARSSER